VAEPCATRTSDVSPNAITSSDTPDSDCGIESCSAEAIPVERSTLPNDPPAAVIRMMTPALMSAS
jgi:hypothetical protein